MALTDLIPNPNAPSLIGQYLQGQRGLGNEPQPLQMPNIAPAPVQTLRPLVRNPQDDLMQNLQAQRTALLTPKPSQPGFWHQLGRVSAKIGEIAGGTLFPGVVAQIPGTELNRQIRLGRLNEQIGEMQTEQQKAQESAAQTAEQQAKAGLAQTQARAGELVEITPEMADELDNPALAGQQVTQGALQHMQTAHTAAQARTTAATTMANRPSARNPFEQYQSNPEAYMKFLKDKASAEAKSNPNGPIRAFYGAIKGLDTAYRMNPALTSVFGPAIQQMFQSYGLSLPPGAGDILSSMPVGQPTDEAGRSIGLSQPGAPTGQTRSRGQFAESVLPSISDAQGEIDRLGDQLGPMQGRFKELYTGKVGAYGPEFSHLQTTLKNIGTAWMRLHANSETARQEFEAQLSAAQNPANLIATLNSIDEQARDYVAEGKGRPTELGKTQQEKGGKQPARPANVPEGYVFKANGPKGRGWYKP